MCEHQPRHCRAPSSEAGLAPCMGKGVMEELMGKNAFRRRVVGWWVRRFERGAHTGRRQGWGAVNIPISMIKVVANVSASVANSGAP